MKKLSNNEIDLEQTQDLELKIKNSQTNFYQQQSISLKLAKPLDSSNYTDLKTQKTHQDFLHFLEKSENLFLNHPIVLNNQFTQWFAEGEISLEQMQNFTVQFSVFSNFFLVAQLKKMINSDSIEGMRKAKEILANEIGVIFKKTHNSSPNQLSTENNSNSNSNNETSPELVSTQGSIDGGTFRFQAAHFEWLLHFGSHLGLKFNDLGKRKLGTPSTLYFCDQLDQFYGAEDSSLAAGASFAIENWAAESGFWKQLISGIKIFKNQQCPQLPLGFFVWHDQIEAQHADHTHEELEEIFFQKNFDEEKFLQGGLIILDALSEFWNGMERDRVSGHSLAQKSSLEIFQKIKKSS